MTVNTNKFKSYCESAIRPKKLHLIVFGFLISPIILFGLYSLSFSWFISFETLLIPVYIGAIIVLGISLVLDEKYKSSLKYYAIVSLVLLCFYTALSYPIRDWLIFQSEKQGEKIANLIEKYKTINGHYPDSLNVEFFNDIPKRSAIGTRFKYSKSLNESKKAETYWIEYFSFKGYLGHYNMERNKWHYTD